MKRFIPLDILRGLTIALMIIVNTPGSWAYVYPPFLHASWHGCTLTDLVYPFFLFVVGAAMAFSFKKYNYILNAALAKKIIKRAFLIFLIGLLLNAYPFFGKDYEKLRIMGVLQRIGIAYGLGAIAVTLIRNQKHLLIFSISILFTYWGILYWGSDEPYSLESNIGRVIDLYILGDHHMWHGKQLAFDPEGLLSTLPSIVSVIFGYMSVKWFINAHLKWSYIIGLGIGLVFVGGLWGFVFPINKSLWTSSYVVLSTGWAIMVLGVLQGLTTKKYFTTVSYPFIVLGSNPLFIFVLSGLVIKTYFKIHLFGSDGQSRNMYSYIYNEIMVPLFGHMNGSLAFALFHLLLFYIIALWMYKKNVFIKI